MHLVALICDFINMMNQCIVSYDLHWNEEAIHAQ